MAEIVCTSFGEPAVTAVARALSAGRGPLDPGLVVCGGSLVAVGLRRALAMHLGSGSSGGGGMAGVEVTTYSRLLEALSTPSLAERGLRRASPMEFQVALRAELAERPGRFGAVASHRTTEERLLQLDAELYGLPIEQRRMLGELGGLTGDALRALNGATERLEPALSPSRSVDLALEALEVAEPDAMGPIVLYLPDPIRPADGRLCAALARRDDCTVVVGLTGVDDIDRRHQGRLAGWGLPAVDLERSRPKGPFPSPLEGGRLFAPARQLEVADPDDEVRAAVRELVAHAAAGESLSTMGLLYTVADPYAALIQHHLDTAGIPYGAAASRPVAHSVAGRLLFRLLALVGSDFDRASIMTLVAAAPVRSLGGELAPASEWDRLSRLAGVVDDDDWSPRLAQFADGLDPERYGRERRELASLGQFVAELRNRCRGEEAPRTWQAWSRWAQVTMQDLIGFPDGWPEGEVRAWEAIQDLLDRLARLDVLDTGPRRTSASTVDPESFRTLVASQLDDLMLSRPSTGAGLLVSSVHAAAGIPVDRVAVVGCNEGVFPRVGREDSLLGDQARALAGGLLLGRSEQEPMDRRAVTAVVAAASGRAVVTMSRGDLRTRRTRAWPKSLEGLVDPSAATVIASHHRGMLDHGRPASADDFRLRSMMLHVEAGEPAETHPAATLDPFLSRSLRRSRRRRLPELNEDTGLVPAGAVDPTARRLSPTALETYAACPRRYLLERVLRIAEADRPERTEEISPRDRGTLLHTILERFLGEAIDADRVPAPGERWRPADLDRLGGLLTEAVAEAAGRGLTGGRVRTELLRRDLASELALFIDRDNDLRAQRSCRPHAVELELGMDADGPPAVLNLTGGRSVALRGVIDRVDLTDDGGVLVVDYKGGSSRPFSGLADDPLKGGRRLQLPIYARLAADELGRDGPRTALYWLTREDKLLDVELVDELDADLDRHVGAALDGIEAGLFPGVPGGRLGWPRLTFENCNYCDFDRICPTDRQREWDAVSDDERLTRVELLLGTPDR